MDINNYSIVNIHCRYFNAIIAARIYFDRQSIQSAFKVDGNANGRAVINSPDKVVLAVESMGWISRDSCLVMETGETRAYLMAREGR